MLLIQSYNFAIDNLTKAFRLQMVIEKREHNMHSFNFPFKLFKEDIKIMSFKFRVLYSWHMTLDIKRKQENNNKNTWLKTFSSSLPLQSKKPKKQSPSLECNKKQIHILPSLSQGCQHHSKILWAYKSGSGRGHRHILLPPYKYRIGDGHQYSIDNWVFWFSIFCFKFTFIFFLNFQTSTSCTQ